MEKLDRILQAGNQAMLAKQYDEAIRLFDSGLAISPNELAIMTSKSSPLRLRGVERYNKSINLGDEKVKAALKDQTKQDLRDSASLATEVIKQAQSQPLEIIESKLDGTNNVLRLANRAEALRLVATIVDKTQVDEALAAAHE